MLIQTEAANIDTVHGTFKRRQTDKFSPASCDKAIAFIKPYLFSQKHFHSVGKYKGIMERSLKDMHE